MKKILAILICLLTASNALAQDLPLTQKQWYGIGVIGEPPETSSYSGITDQTAYLTGLVNVAGNTCFAAASASCYLYVALAGPLGVISTKLMDGTFIPITDIGIETLAGNYFWESGSARFEAWAGTAINIDDIASTTEMPYVGNFNHMWDTVNDNWDRMTGFEIRLSVKDMMALLTYSANMFLVGDTWYDWTGGAMSDAMGAAPSVPWVGSMNAFYDGTNYRRWQGTTAADGLTYPNAPQVIAVTMLDNGATINMAKSGTGTSTNAMRTTLASDDPAVASLAKNPWAKMDDDATVNCVAITAGSVPFDFSVTMPGWTDGDWICMGATGTTAFLNCGAAPTVTTAVGGYSFTIHSGATKCRRLVGPQCAVIGTVAPVGASICFEHLDGDL